MATLLLGLNGLALLLAPTHALRASGRALRTPAPPSPGEATCAPPAAFRQRMENSGDAQYHATMRIGGQVMRGILDTGSFEVVAFSKRCPTCGTAAAYDEGRSAGFVKGARTGTHSYGSGSCSTQDGFDTVELGCYSAERQALWLATDCQMQVLLAATFNAIIGIAPPGEPEFAARQDLEDLASLEEKLRREGREPTDKLKSAKAEAQAMLDGALEKPALLQSLNISTFSTCFGRAPGSPAYMIWNDETRQGVPGVMEVPVIGNISWGVALRDLALVGLAGGRVSIGCKDGCGAVVDTGTSLLGVPTSVYRSVLDALRGMRADLDCASLDAFPDLTLDVGGHRLRLPPSAYIGSAYGQMNARTAQLLRTESIFGSEGAPCQLLLMDLGEPRTAVGPMLILGMPFFREYYTTFSLGGGRGDRSLHVSPAGGDCEPDLAPRVEEYMASGRGLPRRVDASKLLVPRWLESDSQGVAL